MLKFCITVEERHRAQKRVQELDVRRADPARSPSAWANGIGMVAVDYWYDVASPDGKIGTIYFHAMREGAGGVSPMVECTTEITHRPAAAKERAPRVRVTDLQEHEKLVECFFQELLGKAPQGREVPSPQDAIALKRRIEELDALNHVATILHSTHDLRRVLELAMERIGAALRAEAGSLLLQDEATGELVFTVVLGPVADRIRGRRLARGQGVAGWVAESGEAVLVPVASADPRFSNALDQEVDFVTHSILSAPLRTSQGIIGVVQLLNHVDGRPFSRTDLQLLETIALQAATVIERARLLERERKFATLLALSQLAEELSAPLESLEYHLVGLFTNAPPQDPDMVATLENAIERVGTIRRVLKDLSSSSPEESPKTSSRPR